MSVEKPIHILLVEDDDAHAELVDLALEDGDIPYKLTRVSSGEEALEVLFEDGAVDRFGCVFLDLKLKRMSGLEVLEAVRTSQTPRLRNIPVIMLTTSVHEKDLELAYQGHVNSFVKKPLEFETFQRVVQDLQRYWCVHNVAQRAPAGSSTTKQAPSPSGSSQ